MLCQECLEVFHDFGPYQSHILTCNSPSYIQLKYKVDQVSLDTLACSLWTNVFVKKLKAVPLAHSFSKNIFSLF